MEKLEEQIIVQREREEHFQHENVWQHSWENNCRGKENALGAEKKTSIMILRFLL